jgi:hypothetical protein
MTRVYRGVHDEMAIASCDCLDRSCFRTCCCWIIVYPNGSQLQRHKLSSVGAYGYTSYTTWSWSCRMLLDDKEPVLRASKNAEAIVATWVQVRKKMKSHCLPFTLKHYKTKSEKRVVYWHPASFAINGLELSLHQSCFDQWPDWNPHRDSIATKLL